ncbi:MAG TPA: sulfatase-like hydrolase/transferase [Chloroflexota bacterium]|nr:sulfatase-like hydrolase/transferase [Chloroflexota bacterium]
MPNSHPNVLVIMTDQFRWDCLGAAGNRQVRTPHLDRIAADGVRYANTFCTLPVCTPSRYSLLSGLYVHQHGGWGNRCTLGTEIDTFPRALLRAGYRTKGVGKMHFTPTYLDVGFQELALAEQNGPGRYDDDYHRELMANGLVPASDLVDQEREWRGQAPTSYWETFGAERSNLSEEWHSTTWIGDRAVRSIEQWTPDQPHLLMASFVKPHHPFDPPAPWDEMYDPESLDILPGWTPEVLPRDQAHGTGYFPNETLTEAALRRVMAYYYATISQIDHHVGRMIAALEQQGLYEDTMIVFTADHGEFLGFHHMLLKGGLMYDPLARIPLLIKFPGNAQAGTVRDVLASNADIASTIVRQAGLDPSPLMRGLDLSDPASTARWTAPLDRQSRWWCATLLAG